MNRQWGIRFDGIGNRIEEILINYLKDKEEFIYLEVGFADGQTAKSIYDITKENIKHNNWLILGLDLVQGYSTNLQKTRQIWGNELLIQEEKPTVELLNNVKTGNYHAGLILKNNPREWVKSLENESIDIALIDADHSYRESTADFLAIESKIKLGGLIAFHDTCILSQGTDYQSFSDDFINVRRALSDLGLLDNKRPDWKLKEEILGSRFIGKDGNGMIFIEKS